ncbi:Protein of unknown function DUF241 [Macleaya cordata]|uniref:DUF241 domain protein n=1 Tax=Macleaya cordata TaxID=56857 RepID=A0A200QLB9_MACCD|nr:Protein of unknown function DUF241 [Macleaya cordata]
MAGSSSIRESRYHVRSISFPPRSNPIALKIEEELNKLNITWDISSSSNISTLKSETIQLELVGLVELYNSVDDLIHSPLTQKALCDHRHEKLVEEVVDESVRLLDVCGTARDFLLMMKEGVQDLQSALRRKSGGESSVEAKVGAYIRLRKKVKKDINKCVGALKRMIVNNNKIVSSDLILDQDQHLSVVVRVLREVSLITMSIFRSLLLFMSAQPRSSRWSLVSKLLHKGQVASCCDQEAEESNNEVASADVAVQALCDQHISSKDGKVERVQIKLAQKRLKALEVSIEDVEEGVGCIYKRLIKTRVTLLNIFTH